MCCGYSSALTRNLELAVECENSNENSIIHVSMSKCFGRLNLFVSLSSHMKITETRMFICFCTNLILPSLPHFFVAIIDTTTADKNAPPQISHYRKI